MLMRLVPLLLMCPLQLSGCQISGAPPEVETPEAAAAPEDLESGVREETAEPDGAAHLTAPDLDIAEPPPTPTASLPNAADLEGTEPFIVRRLRDDPPDGQAVDPGSGFVAAPSETRLEVRDSDGSLSAIWRLPEGATIQRISDAVSPDGHWLAFFTGDEPDWHLTAPITTPLTLHVWDLHAGVEEFATPVLRRSIRDDLRRQTEELAREYSEPDAQLPPDWSDPTGTMLAMTAEDVVFAVYDGLRDVKWSPDGRHIAFVGALHGPSTDVYVLDTDDGSVARVSEEPTHVIHMSWSPDGRWLLHEGAEYSSRAGGYTSGLTTDASAADGSVQRHLWSGSRIGGWDWWWPRDWIGEAEAVLHSVGHGCGVCEIVSVDASAGMTRTLQRVSAHEPAVGPSGNTAAIGGRIESDDSDGGGTAGHKGVYILALDGSGTTRVHDLRCRVAQWDADELPYVWLPTHTEDGCTTAAFGEDGSVMHIDAPLDLADASVSPGGVWRVLFGDSGWILYDRESIERSAHVGDVGAGSGAPPWLPVETVSWHPDDIALYWLASGQLWRAELPDGEPRLLGPWPERPGYRPDIDVAWIRP